MVDLLLDERPLSDDSATIAECGLSNGKAVLAIFKQRCVECVRWQDAKEDLTVADNPVRLIIPDGTTEVPSLAFRACVSIQSVRIPSSVTSIGDAAFSACCALKHLTIPESVTSIGRAAFASCSGLSALTLPESVSIIGPGASLGCTSLTSLKNHQFGGRCWTLCIQCLQLSGAPCDSAIFPIGDLSASTGSMRSGKDLTCLVPGSWQADRMGGWRPLGKPKRRGSQAPTKSRAKQLIKVYIASDVSRIV